MGRGFVGGVLPWGLLVLLAVTSAGGWPAGVDRSIFSGDNTAFRGPLILGPGADGTSEEDGTEAAGSNSRIIGVGLFGSGVFLCSWGITAWEVSEYQCCPAHNTGNVVKIVAGLVLINAGLIYLLGGND